MAASQSMNPISPQECKRWGRACALDDDTKVPTKQAECRRYLARMSYIALAAYLTERALIPDRVVSRGHFAGVDFYVLNPTTRWGARISRVLKGVGEAIQRGYARRAILMLNEDPLEPDSASEVWS